MKTTITLSLAAAFASVLAAGCFSHPADVPNQVHVGGQVAGMWDGAAIELHLQAGDVDSQLMVSANQSFDFAETAAQGDSFAVTIVTAPTGHDCILAGGTGTLGADDYEQVRVDCTGPAVDIALSVPQDLSFDAEVTSYSIEASVLLQQVTATVTSDAATAITIDDAPVTSGAQSDPVALQIGANTITVDVQVDAASRQYQFTIDRDAVPPEQYVYGKAPNPGAADGFFPLAASGDTLVIGASGEDSSTFLINGPFDEGRQDSGAAYVWRRRGGTWTNEAFLRASLEAGDAMGTSVAISANTIVLGAPFDDGLLNNVSNSGAVYVFVRNGTQWAQQAVLRAPNPIADEHFGNSIALDGDVIAVGRLASDLGTGTGDVTVFRRTGTSWMLEDQLHGSLEVNGDPYGAVAVAGDLLAASCHARVYLFRYAGGSWAEEDVLIPANWGSFSGFGGSLSAEGDTVVVGDTLDSFGTRGVNPVDDGSVAANSGAVYVYRNIANAWSLEAFIKSSNSDPFDTFGVSVSLSGSLLAVGAIGDGSSATGVDGDSFDNSLQNAGAAYLFARAGSTWSEVHYIKASNTEAQDTFRAVALSGDTLAVAAPGDDSSSAGFGGDQGNDASTMDSGAVYLFR